MGDSARQCRLVPVLVSSADRTHSRRANRRNEGARTVRSAYGADCMTRIVAVFDSPHAVERAIEASQHAGWRAVTVCSPAFDERLLQHVGAARSPVAVWALIGAILGSI